MKYCVPSLLLSSFMAHEENLFQMGPLHVQFLCTLEWCDNNVLRVGFWVCPISANLPPLCSWWWNLLNNWMLLCNNEVSWLWLTFPVKDKLDVFTWETSGSEYKAGNKKHGKDHTDDSLQFSFPFIKAGIFIYTYCTCTVPQPVHMFPCQLPSKATQHCKLPRLSFKDERHKDGHMRAISFLIYLVHNWPMGKLDLMSRSMLFLFVFINSGTLNPCFVYFSKV